MNKLKSFLVFIRLIDEHDNKLSLTNLTVTVAILRIAMTQQLSMVELGILFTALLAYSVKKLIHLNTKPDVNSDLVDLKQKVEEIQSITNSLAMQNGIKKLSK